MTEQPAILAIFILKDGRRQGSLDSGNALVYVIVFVGIIVLAEALGKELAVLAPIESIGCFGKVAAVGVVDFSVACMTFFFFFATVSASALNFAIMLGRFAVSTEPGSITFFVDLRIRGPSMMFAIDVPSSSPEVSGTDKRLAALVGFPGSRFRVAFVGVSERSLTGVSVGPRPVGVVVFVVDDVEACVVSSLEMAEYLAPSDNSPPSSLSLAGLIVPGIGFT